MFLLSKFYFAVQPGEPMHVFYIRLFIYFLYNNFSIYSKEHDDSRRLIIHMHPKREREREREGGEEERYKGRERVRKREKGKKKNQTDTKITNSSNRHA